MEMTLSTISNLRPFVRQRDLLPDVNGGVARLIFSSYGPSDLALPDRFWIFSHSCREEDYPRNIPVCYVLDNGDSSFRLSGDVDQAVRFIFSEILVLVLLPMLVDYFNGWCMHVVLISWLKLKLWKNYLWYYRVHRLTPMSCSFGCLQKSSRLCHGRRVWRP